MTLPALPADFPPPDKLPSKPEIPDPLTMLDGTKVATKSGLGREAAAGTEGALPALHVRPLSRRTGEGDREGAVRGREGVRRQGHAARSGDSRSARRSGRRSTCSSRRPTARRRPRASSARTSAATTCSPTTRRSASRPSWMPDRYPGVVEEQGDRGGPRQAGRHLAAGRGRSAAATRSPRSTAATSSPTGPTCAKGCGRRFRLPEGGQAGDETATIMWWAWGIHRAVDYLVDRQDASTRSGSRSSATRGWARRRCLAGAFDDRIAVVIPHQAGCGGAGRAARRTRRPRR